MSWSSENYERLAFNNFDSILSLVKKKGEGKKERFPAARYKLEIMNLG